MLCSWSWLEFNQEKLGSAITMSRFEILRGFITQCEYRIQYIPTDVVCAQDQGAELFMDQFFRLDLKLK